MPKARVDVAQLERACGSLGDTVLDPALWPDVMEKICQAVGATAAMMLQSDIRTFDVPRTLSIDEAIRNYFRESFHVRDTRAARAVPLLLNGAVVVTDQDILSPQEIRTDPMYNETLVPFGFQWFAGVGFRADTALWGLCLQRTIAEGPFEKADKPLLAPLSQKLSEVATLSTAVGRQVLSSATNALNSVRQPAIAIDRNGFVLDANAGAETVFADDIHIKNRRLFLIDAQAKDCLEKTLDRLRVTLVV
jgi:hypothetical protein